MASCIQMKSSRTSFTHTQFQNQNFHEPKFSLENLTQSEVSTLMNLPWWENTEIENDWGNHQSQVYFDAENYVKCNEMKNINWILTKCNWSVFYEIFLQEFRFKWSIKWVDSYSDFSGSFFSVHFIILRCNVFLTRSSKKALSEVEARFQSPAHTKIDKNHKNLSLKLVHKTKRQLITSAPSCPWLKVLAASWNLLSTYLVFQWKLQIWNEKNVFISKYLQKH